MMNRKNSKTRSLLLSASLRASLICGVALAFSACSEDPSSNPEADSGPRPDGPVVNDGPPPNAELTWSRQILDYETAGEFTSAASSGNKVGVIYFSKPADKVDKPCPSGSGGAPVMQPRIVQDLRYIQYDGNDWSSPSTIVQTVEGTFGTSLVFDQSGNPHAGYLGGELSVRECASSDAVIATSTDGGQNWTERIVQGAGDTGDTVGHWTSVALNPSDGSITAAYRDVHFGFYEQDGNARADLLYNGGENLSPDIGDGVNTNLVFKSDGTPVVLAANMTKTGADGGIKLYVKNGAEWTKQQLAPAGLGPRLATDGQGNFMVAYYHPTEKSLKVIESADLESWTPAVDVDKGLTNHGTFVSLAYDSAGNPAVAYYRCSKAGENDCVPDQDGLMFAWRLAGRWQTWEVDTGDSNICGVYSGLAFDQDDTPFISYQCITFDNVNNQFIEVLKVAKGTWKTQ